MGNKKRTELELLIEKECYNSLFNALTHHVLEHRKEFDDDCSNTDLGDLYLLFVANIRANGNLISFEAIVSGVFSIRQSSQIDNEQDITEQWFRMSCEMVIETEVRNFKVKNVEIYIKKPQTKTGITGSLVPIITKNEFDDEATRFLEKYCPEALKVPMKVPIADIVQNKMGLDLVTDYSLSPDFSIFGQICFSEGNIKVYNPDTKKYQIITINKPTVFVDSDTYFLRNLGCVNNTIVHEAFHYERHRMHAVIKSIINGEDMIAYRCPALPLGEVYKESNRDDGDWIEWQANGIAPKILMPKNTTTQKIKELLELFDYEDDDSDSEIILKNVIDELADFFGVSKQAAKIRMIELGYEAVKAVYNYDFETADTVNNISLKNAFYEYCDNEDFRTVINSGAFAYAEEQFVIRNDKYVTRLDSGGFALTEYAKENITECGLKFSYLATMIEHSKYSDVFRRDNKQGYKSIARYPLTEENNAIFDTAVAIAQFQVFLDKSKSVTQTFSEKAAALMEAQHWNSAIFCERTLMDEVLYGRIKNNPEYVPKIESVIALCAGLDLDFSTSEELLKSAGYALGNSRKHKAYGFILSAMPNTSIYERNAFLEGMGFEPLGSKQRK